MENNQDKAREYFKELTKAHRANLKKYYERNLEIARGDFDPGVYPLTHKRAGQQMPYPERFEWMIPAWENGLRILNSVINELDEND